MHDMHAIFLAWPLRPQRLFRMRAQQPSCFDKVCESPRTTGPVETGPSALRRSLFEADLRDMNILERINLALEGPSSTATSTATENNHPFLRDAVIACVPDMTDDQVERIDAEVGTKCHYALISRLTACSVLVQGIAIRADSPLDADRTMWERMNVRVRTALCQPSDVNTRITSINVSPASGLQ